MVLLDTNILLRRANDQDPLQLLVSRTINGLIRDGEDCCTCS